MKLQQEQIIRMTYNTLMFPPFGIHTNVQPPLALLLSTWILTKWIPKSANTKYPIMIDDAVIGPEDENQIWRAYKDDVIPVVTLAPTPWIDQALCMHVVEPYLLFLNDGTYPSMYERQ